MSLTSLYIGVDLSASAAKTALCVLGENAGSRLSVVHAPTCMGNNSDALDVVHFADSILAIVKQHSTGNAVVGIDAPFGWPSSFVDGVGKHSASRPHSFGSARVEYRYRATDCVVRERLGLVPLSPSTDRIGVVALVAAALVRRLLDSDSGFRVALDEANKDLRRVIEVYPEATISSWFGLRAFKGYKKDANIRSSLVEALIEREQRAGISLPSLRSDHEVDALIAALTAREFASSRCVPPPESAAVVREGWIWFPKPERQTLATV